MSHLLAPTAARTTAALLIAASTTLFVVGACSLGEGVTPDCDNSLPPGEPGACQGLGVCDDGRGGVLPNEGCCIDASRQLLAICLQEEVSGDWRLSCQAGAALAGRTCTVTTGEMNDKSPTVQVNEATEGCLMASDVFNHCLAGGLSFSGGGVGGAGTGGAGTGGMAVGGANAGGAGTGGTMAGAGGG